ncbi:MAG: ABC transporter ATP-binding protein [Corynebacterium sp.]|nr:ABC transporter ATP-binding protein [Corynebacterium sp.]
MPAIQAENLTQRYKDFEALKGVSFELKQGRILGVLGPNGAGKSTLIKILCGTHAPYSGTVRIFGMDPVKPAARIGLGVVGQQSHLPAELTPLELAEFFAAHHAVTGRTRAERKAYSLAHLEKWNLAEFKDKRMSYLSGGQRHRVAVAMGFIGNPELILLDEPTTGLDPQARSVLWGYIRGQVQNGTSVLLTSHYLDEVEHLADDLLLISEGRSKSNCTKEEFISVSTSTTVSFRTSTPERLHSIGGVEDLVISGDEVSLRTQDIGQFIKTLGAADISVQDFVSRRPSLEEAMEVRLRDD